MSQPLVGERPLEAALVFDDQPLLEERVGRCVPQAEDLVHSYDTGVRAFGQQRGRHLTGGLAPHHARVSARGRQRRRHEPEVRGKRLDHADERERFIDLALTHEPRHDQQRRGFGDIDRVGPRKDGAVYVSTLPGGPESPALGARGAVYRVDRHGNARPYVPGLVSPTGIAFDQRGTLYVASLFGEGVLKVAHRSSTPTVVLPAPLAADVDVDGRLLYATTDALGSGALVKARR